jgi:succinyl-CoA synthetase beta subunit
MGLSIPVVARLEGTNVDRGKEILRQSGLKITPAEGLSDAAQKAVESAR